MNILLFLYGSIEALTGGTLYDLRIVEFLRSRGHRVEVRSLRRWPYALSPLQSAHPGTWRSLAAARWDCLLVDELVHPSLAPAVALRVPRRPPLGSLVHLLRTAERDAVGAGHGPVWAAVRLLEGMLLRGSDFIVANSRATARLVRERTGERVPVHICPPGLERPARPAEPAAASPRGGPGHPPRILSVANLSRIKGQDLLIEALAGLRHLPWRLDLVGSGEADRRFRRHMEEGIRRHGLDGRVSRRGALRGPELEKAWAQADLFVLPSRLEMYGMALAEALGHGLPCVAFDTGGVGEVLTGGGLLVPPGDVGALRGALASLLADAELRRRLGGRAREAAGRLPTWEEAGRRFEAILRQATGAAG